MRCHLNKLRNLHQALSSWQWSHRWLVVAPSHRRRLSTLLKSPTTNLTQSLTLTVFPLLHLQNDVPPLLTIFVTMQPSTQLQQSQNSNPSLWIFSFSCSTAIATSSATTGTILQSLASPLNFSNTAQPPPTSYSCKTQAFSRNLLNAWLTLPPRPLPSVTLPSHCCTLLYPILTMPSHHQVSSCHPPTNHPRHKTLVLSSWLKTSPVQHSFQPLHSQPSFPTHLFH